MGFKLPDHEAAGESEKRWFNGVIGFSLAAAAVFGRVGFVLWGKGELNKVVQAAGQDVAKKEAALALYNRLQFGEMIGWALLMLCCTGFMICAGVWMREMRRRLRSAPAK